METNEEIAITLLHDLKVKTKDFIINRLIEIGRENIFIPVMTEVVKLIRESNQHSLLMELAQYIDAAYSPGLRAHILDDFIREAVAIQSIINELKTQHHIYILEQKLFMYKQAEKMLRSTATTGTTHVILKILEFRGD